MELVSVDPGKDHFAYAVFRDKKLVSCGIRRWKQHSELVGEASSVARLGTRLVIEKMQVYPNERVKDPNDLIDVTFTAGVIASNFYDVTQVTAQRWKGQVTKEITQSRVIKILGYDPVSHLPKKDGSHVYDAIGLGLQHLGLYK